MLARSESVAPVAPVAPGTGWRARLSLGFGATPDRTVVLDREHSGPLCIQKPFYPGDGSCHVYVLHPPGGLAGGDDLALTARVGTGACALVTMPASTKFYRSIGRTSRLANRLEVANGGSLEWLPPESILFGGSRARLATEIHLDKGARFLGWEGLVLGRPRSGDHYGTGGFEQRLACHVGGRPVLLERLAAAAGDAVLAAPWGLAGLSCLATLVAWPADRDRLDAVRAALAGQDHLSHGATIVDGLLVLRLAGRTAESVRTVLEAVRDRLAPALLGRAATPPRIWKT